MSSVYPNTSGIPYIPINRKETIMDLFSTLCIIIAGILWGTMGIFVRYLGNFGFSSLQIACMRIIITGILFFLFLIVIDKEKLKIKKKDIPLFLAMGWGSILFFTICYFTTIQTTSLAIAAILLYTSPIFVVVLSSVFLQEKITGIKMAALSIAFVGCILVSGVGGAAVITGKGFIIGLCSGLGYGLYSIFGSLLLKKYHPYTVSAYAFIFAGIGAICICDLPDIIGKIYVSGNILGMLGFILLTGAVTAFVPFLLYTLGLQKVEASKAAIMAMIEPLVAALIGIFVFKEVLTVQAASGIVCIFLAIMLLNNKTKEKDN